VLPLPRSAVWEPLSLWNIPFSRSASPQGPEPVHGAKQQVVARDTASMWPLPVSAGVLSALP
jgi:hypothetical protein